MSRPGGYTFCGRGSQVLPPLERGELICKARLPGVRMGFVFSGGEDYLWQCTPYQQPGRVTRR